VYHIDLSFLKSSLVDSENLEDYEIKYDLLYKSEIIKNIRNYQDHMTACMACGSNFFKEASIDERKIIEAECSGVLGCHFCLLDESINKVSNNDLVIVKNGDCTEIAKVIESGEIVKLKRQKLGLYGEDLPIAVRKATEEDLNNYRKNLHEEAIARPIFKEKVEKFNLIMKLVNIHYQFDRKKLFFFYTSDGRVDFRELAKDLASRFKTRIELRQIGVRDEAKKIGGLGTCGREYCCASFLSNFRRITTQLASEQNLVTNMAKLSGPCGKLKCCLSFEIESLHD